AGGRPAVVVDDVGSERPGGATVREGDPDLQRDRLTPDVPAGASQSGAQGAGPCRGSGELDSFLLRDGRALARYRPRARLSTGGRRGGREAVRRSVGAEGPRGEER